MSKPFYSSEVAERTCADNWWIDGCPFLCGKLLGEYYDIPKDAQKIRVHLYKKPAEGTGDVPLCVSEFGFAWEWKWKEKGGEEWDLFEGYVCEELGKIYPNTCTCDKCKRMGVKETKTLSGEHRFFVQIEIIE